MTEGTLHFKNNDGEWSGLYVDFLKNRLRRDKNLSDLGNKAEARENLELIGEVTDHWHDSRYIPKIEEVRGHADALAEKLEKEIEELRDKLEKEIADVRKICNSNTNRISALEGRVSQLESRVSSLSSRLNSLSSSLSNLFDSEGYLTYPNGNKLRVTKG